jgi:acyl carrier protein
MSIHELKTTFVLNFVEGRTGNRVSASDDLFEVAGLDSLDFMELLEDFSNEFDLGEKLFELEDWNLIRTADGMVSSSD